MDNIQNVFYEFFPAQLDRIHESHTYAKERSRHKPSILPRNNGETHLSLTRACVEHNPELRKTKMTLCRGKYNTALLCNPNQDVRMTMQDECLLTIDIFKHIDIQIQRRSEQQGRTPGFKDSNMNNFVTFDQTNIRRKTEDGVGF